MNSQPSVLIIEDDVQTAEVVGLYLENAGFRMTHVVNGIDGLAEARSGQHQIVLLDLMLPGMDGRELCQVLRQGSTLPLIMLTALSHEEDRLRGFDLGADDYISKPFSPREVISRIRAVLRRTSTPKDKDLLEFGAVSLLRRSHEVHVHGALVDLTPTEFRLLDVFLNSPNRVFSRDELISRVLGVHYCGFDRTIDAHIKNLRRKLEPTLSKSSIIHTVFGVGYKLSLCPDRNHKSP